MKALVIDSAASCISIAAKNDDLKTTLTLDLGQKQSQSILPAIDFVLQKLGLAPSELDYMALCEGPGTFTGLRLAFSALKAIELSYGIPIYGIPTLQAYAHPFRNFPNKVLSVIDAKKDQFFVAIYQGENVIFEAKDTTAEEIAGLLDNEAVIIAGPDSAVFKDLLLQINPKLNIYFTTAQPLPTDSLFEISEKFIAEKIKPLSDYSGPVYLRKSEAEIALEKK